MAEPGAPPDPAFLPATIDHINGRILGTRLPYRTRSFGKAGSTIVAVRFSRPEYDYFIKLKRPQPGYGSTTESTRRSLTREYLTLRALDDVPHASFALPRPLFYDEERLLLATSAVPGTPFLARYRLAARIGLSRRRELEADLRALGTALAEFHGLARQLGSDARKVIAGERNVSIPAALARKLDHDALQRRPRLRDAVRGWLAGAGPDAAPHPRSALTHNDLGLHNVLCGERPGLLDLDSVSIGDPEADLAYLLLALVDLTLPVPAQTWRRARLERLTRRLLEGYGAGIRTDRLKPHLVNVGVQWIIDLDVRHRGARSLARRAYDRRLLARQARILAEVLSPAGPSWVTTPADVE